MTSPRVDVQGMIRELCEPTTHSEPVTQPQHNRDGSITWHTTRHTVTWPPLLTQLAAAILQSGAAEDGVRPGFGSKPPARIDALDAHQRIETQAARWLRVLHQNDDGDARDVVLRLNGQLPSLEQCPDTPRKHDPADADPCCTRHAVERDIRKWWTTARVLTGWDQPAWKPHNTCPLCGKRGTVALRVEQETAACTNCHETWSPAEFYLLIEHIRAENMENEEAPA